MVRFELVTREEKGFFPKPPLTFVVAPRVGEQIQIGDSAFEVAMLRHFVSANEGELPDPAGLLVLDRIVDAQS